MTSHAYPRPLLTRANWTSLNGEWSFAIDADARLTSAADVKWNRKIKVPFAPETPNSGVNDTSFYRRVWYRRTFTSPKEMKGDRRLILHFGAVDHFARVWINGRLAVEHEGGYTPFSADITDLLKDGAKQTIEVCADDDPHDLCKPRGKQDWQLKPHGIWYPRTTGIWQTVWLEVVPNARVESLHWRPDVSHTSMHVHARLSAAALNIDGLRWRIRLRFGKQTLVDDVYSVNRDEVIRTLVLADPSVEDFNIDFLWTPDHPNLIDAEVDLVGPDDKLIDHVESYCAMRTVAIEGDRFTLNRRPIYLRMALDQGYWLESGLTPPSDDAIRRDVELAKQMGFNGVRKHQKIEDPRFLYWADRLGLMVWGECPSPYRFDPLSVERMTRVWTEAIERDRSHPCIICWVPFNESWGVPDLATQKSQRDLVRAMFYLTKSMDPTRPSVGNDGWEAVVGDFLAIHDYERDPQKLIQYYNHDDSQLTQQLLRRRVSGRLLRTSECDVEKSPILLTEFGGIGFSDQPGTWGYTSASTPEQLASEYHALLEAVRSIAPFAGFCYTQFTDTYQEANGLLKMDRTPKFPIEEIRKATVG